MNIHPLFVHFPIALLTVYAILELIRFDFIEKRPEFFYIKYTFAVLGTILSYVTFWTGVLASGLVDKSPAMELHEKFAFLTCVLFSFIAFGYLVEFSEKIGFEQNASNPLLHGFWLLCAKIKSLLARTGMRITLALIGFILLSITAGLGGVIAFGPNFDFSTHLITKLFHLV